jgi:hypothetical protein
VECGFDGDGSDGGGEFRIPVYGMERSVDIDGESSIGDRDERSADIDGEFYEGGPNYEYQDTAGNLCPV